MKKIIVCTFFLALSASLLAQRWLWGKEGSTGAYTWNAAGDKYGNAFLTGTFNNTIAFGSYNFTSPVRDCYLVKYDSNGNIRWANQSLSNSPYSLAFSYFNTTDKAGNIYITGLIQDTVLFGATALISDSGTAAFIAKYDTGGNLVWARQSVCDVIYSGTSGLACVADKSGNIYETGIFGDSVSFGATSLTCYYPYGLFLVKYSNNGSVIWAKQSNNIQSASWLYPYSVTTDNNKNIYVTGWFMDSVSFGSNTIVGNTSGDMFLVKYDSNGNALWARQSVIASVRSGCQGLSVITDKANNVYVTGNFYDTASFGAIMLTCSGTNLFLVKYSPSGALIWAKQSTQGGKGYTLAIDSSDRLYLSGGSSWDFTFNNDTLNTAISYDPSILLQMDTSANVLCASIITCGGYTYNSVTTSPSGKYVYLASVTSDTITFDTNFLNTNTGEPFVARWQHCQPAIIDGANTILKPGIMASVSPNPNNGSFNLLITGQEQGTNRAEIYNAFGEKILTLPISHAGLGTTRIIMNDQPPGVYLYRILTDNGKPASSGKFIIE